MTDYKTAVEMSNFERAAALSYLWLGLVAPLPARHARPRLTSADLTLPLTRIWLLRQH